MKKVSAELTDSTISSFADSQRIMEKILDRFLRYIAIDTQADPNSDSQPSAAKELNLSRLLCDELTAMGVQADLDEYGYVMADRKSVV